MAADLVALLDKTGKIFLREFAVASHMPERGVVRCANSQVLEDRTSRLIGRAREIVEGKTNHGCG
jgi:hypothetical protein